MKTYQISYIIDLETFYFYFETDVDVNGMKFREEVQSEIEINKKKWFREGEVTYWNWVPLPE